MRVLKIWSNFFEAAISSVTNDLAFLTISMGMYKATLYISVCVRQIGSFLLVAFSYLCPSV